MKKLIPGNTTLWLTYKEDEEAITGLTDLTVSAKYASTGTQILASTSLVEDGTSGDYYYEWNISNIELDTLVLVYYKKGSEVLYVEEVIVEVLEDMDGIAM